MTHQRCTAIPSFQQVPLPMQRRIDLRCVMFLNHDPIPLGNGEYADHNWGGLGPFTPGRREPSDYCQHPDPANYNWRAKWRCPECGKTWRRNWNLRWLLVRSHWYKPWS